MLASHMNDRELKYAGMVKSFEEIVTKIDPKGIGKDEAARLRIQRTNRQMEYWINRYRQGSKQKQKAAVLQRYSVAFVEEDEVEEDYVEEYFE
jgi:hypothetical protein